MELVNTETVNNMDFGTFKKKIYSYKSKKNLCNNKIKYFKFCLEQEKLKLDYLRNNFRDIIKIRSVNRSIRILNEKIDESEKLLKTYDECIDLFTNLFIDKIKEKIIEDFNSEKNLPKECIIKNVNLYFKNITINHLERALRNYTSFHKIVLQNNDILNNIDTLKKIVNSSANISGWAGLSR